MKALLISLVVIVGLVVAPAAQAHTDLVGTTPADGAVVSEAPDSIVLQFNEVPLESLVDVVITDAAGAVVAMDAAEGSGTEVSVPWPASLSSGDYTVAYRVVSADGHPVTGTFSFSYTGDASSTSAPEVDASAAAEVLSDVNGSSPLTPLLIGLVALVVVAVAIVMVRRRVRR